MADEIYAYTHPTDTAANWAAGDRVLALGEVGYDSTNNQLRAGNGVDLWSALPPIAANASGTVDQTARDLAQSALNAATAKYTKPSSGIPQTDLDSATAVKIDAGAAAYRKPAGGIPDTDLASTFIKTVNGNQPDTNGNIVVSGGGGGTVSSVAGKTGDVTLNKNDVGLSNVNNTADADKPVSTAQASAIGAKYTKPSSGIPKTDLDGTTQTSLGKADTALQSAPVTSVAGKTGNVTVTKSDVGLSDVDNLSEADRIAAYNTQYLRSAGNQVWGGDQALLNRPVPTNVGQSGALIALGRRAMAAITDSVDSIAIGNKAMESSPRTRDNIAIGGSTLNFVESDDIYYNQSLKNGTRNIAIGGNAHYFLTKGWGCLSIGRNAGSNLIAGNGLTAIGGGAVSGYAPIGLTGQIENWTPWGNDGDTINTTGVGTAALRLSQALDNTAVGGSSLTNNKKSNYNTAVGANSFAALDTNTGYMGGVNSTLSIAGTYSQSGNTLTITANGHGLAVGDTVVFRLLDGPSQTFQQDKIPALVATIVNANTFTIQHPLSITGTGSAQLYSKETAAQAPLNEQNTALGYSAGQSMLTAGTTTVLGNRSGQTATSGSQSTGVGSHALINATSLSNATALGFYAAGSMTGAATSVTALGASALRTRVDGQPMTDAFSNVTGVGFNSRVSGSNQLQLGDTATTVYAQSAVQTRSDARDKADIRDTVLGLDFIEALRPVDFKWDRREDYTKYDEDGNGVGLAERDGSRKGTRYHHGFIAQELQKTIADSGVDFGGFQDHSVNGGDDVLSVGYEEMIAPMVRAIQELSAQVQALKSELDDLRGN